MSSRKLVLFMILIGCGDDNPSTLDAATPDAAPDANAHCPVPSQPLAPGVSKLYLNTEGVTLTKGSCNDSRTNCTSLVVTDQTMVRPFLQGVAGRQTFIDQIVATAQATLAPYSLDIVTTRPASGDYNMLVLGDNPAIAGAAAGTTAVTPSDCTSSHRNHLGLEFDYSMSRTTDEYAWTILSDVGVFAGLAATTDPNDCMCRFDASCASATATLCSYGSMAPTTTTGPNCGRAPTQDELALLKAALGCR